LGRLHPAVGLLPEKGALFGLGEHRAGGERWEGDAPELAAKLLEIVRERVTI